MVGTDAVAVAVAADADDLQRVVAQLQAGSDGERPAVDAPERWRPAVSRGPAPEELTSGDAFVRGRPDVYPLR